MVLRIHLTGAASGGYANISSLMYRSVTTLNSSIKIDSGSGTPNDPYILKN